MSGEEKEKILVSWAIEKTLDSFEIVPIFDELEKLDNKKSEELILLMKKDLDKLIKQNRE